MYTLRGFGMALVLTLLVGCGGGSSSGVDPYGSKGDGSGPGSDQRSGDGGVDLQVCEPGAAGCAGDHLATCADDGMSWIPGALCDDHDPCTEGDTCQAGACLFTPKSCDDDNGCTMDTCDPFTGECAHGPATGTPGCCQDADDCDDGNPCTQDGCVDDACVHSPTVCAKYHTSLGGKGSEEGQLSNPKGISVTSDNRIVIADSGNNRVLVMSRQWETLGEILEADGVALSAPGGVAVGPGGEIVVMDTGNDRVLWFSPELKLINRWPPQNATQVLFLSPVDVAFLDDEYGFVADGAGEEFDTGERILKVNMASQVVASQGKPGTGDGNFDKISAIETSAAGNLLVADSGNDRIQVLTPALEYQSQFGASGTEDGQLDGPRDLVETPGGKVLVVDTGNGRIQVFGMCQPDCTDRQCGNDGCGGSCGECPSFTECSDEGKCTGWVGEAGEGCTDKSETEEGGCNGCLCEPCVCQGVEPIDPGASEYYDPEAGDPFCCDNMWDQVCIFECMFVCGYECPTPPPEEPLEPVVGYVHQWNDAGSGPMTAPTAITLVDGWVYVVDSIQGKVHVYRYFE